MFSSGVEDHGLTHREHRANKVSRPAVLGEVVRKGSALVHERCMIETEIAHKSARNFQAASK